MNYLVVFEMRRGFSIITPRLQLRALHVCSADQCRSSHGLHCGEADLHPKANRFFSLFSSLSLALSLSRFLSSTSLQSYHVSPPPPALVPPPSPSASAATGEERGSEREREKSAAECERHVDSQPLKCFLGRSLILWRRTEWVLPASLLC